MLLIRCSFELISYLRLVTSINSNIIGDSCSSLMSRGLVTNYIPEYQGFTRPIPTNFILGKIFVIRVSPLESGLRNLSLFSAFWRTQIFEHKLSIFKKGDLKIFSKIIKFFKSRHVCENYFFKESRWLHYLFGGL